MSKLTFFKCLHCGNVIVKVFDQGPVPSCCGEEMAQLTANTTDAAVEKHVPVVTVDGAKVHVEVGSVLHPMGPEHYITMIVLETEKGFQVAQLEPTGQPVADFVVAEGDAPVAVFEYCNLHGLWKAEI